MTELSPGVLELKAELGRAIRQDHDRRQRRKKIRTIAVGPATTLVAVVALATALSTGGASAAPRLSLDRFTLRLPRGSRVLARRADATTSSGRCVAPAAFGAGAPGTPPPGWVSGLTSNVNEPGVISAVTAAGGCLTMALTGAYTPGSDAPDTGLVITPYTTATPVQIDSYQGTVQSDTLTGKDMTYEGVPIPSGYRYAQLDLTIPAANGQVQDLQFVAAGLTEQQLTSLVSSGLSSPVTSG